jgi:hypothetical protein
MSALGQKQTLGSTSRMSALPPKADIQERQTSTPAVTDADADAIPARIPLQSGTEVIHMTK